MRCCVLLHCVCVCLQVIAQRLSKLGTFKKSGAPERQPAEVLIKRRKRGRNGDITWEMVRARGHLDEVLEMRKGGTKLGELCLRPPGTVYTAGRACRVPGHEPCFMGSCLLVLANLPTAASLMLCLGEVLLASVVVELQSWIFLGLAEDLDFSKETPSLVLTEGAILGGGAFSRVSEVKEETTGNTYAMKRMKKQAVVQCPEHVYFEQVRHALPS
jgi:hypothetical protein